MLYLLWLYCIIGYGQSLKIVSFETAMFDIAASTNPRYDINGKIGSLIKVQLPEEGAKFESSMILGDVDYDSGEYKVYVAAGTKRLTVKFPKCLPATIDFSDYGVNATESKTTYVLKILVNREGFSKFKKNSFFIEPEMQLGSLTAIGGSIGGYISHLNVEASYPMGLSESEEVFWNDNLTEDGSIPFSYAYKASYLDVRLGYGIYIGESFCLTPQIGMGIVSLSGTEKQKGDNSPDATRGNALDVSFGVKMSYLFSKHIGVTVVPGYNLAVKKSNLFERVSEVSSKVKTFGTGFNIRIGLFATF